MTNNGKTLSYTYDKNGNIQTIYDGTNTITYSYNALNELTREDNKVLNKAVVYTYDKGGNILSKVQYPYTTGTLGAATSTITYSYDTNWKGKLASYNGNSITYDTIGNPLTYSGYTYTWVRGKELASISDNGLTASYLYNSNGLRTQKTINGTTVSYHLVGNKVTFEDNGTDSIYYTYDPNGMLVSMNLNGTEYFYVRNAQGDIIQLVDKTGATVASYVYDTWGKLNSITGSLASTVGAKNPYRYRGYRYDTETGLYYCNSRYYNPDWGRFLNADVVVGQVGGLLSHNMFAYCGNNPVNMSDPSGYWLETALDVGFISYDVVDIANNPSNGWAWASLGADVACAVLPGVTGGRLAVKGLEHLVDGVCFTEDTKIQTKDGHKVIKDIKVGDEVYSENPETGEKGLKKVKNVYVHETDALVHLKIGNAEIKTTPTHPFWVDGEGWVEAGKLNVGDRLLLSSGETSQIDTIYNEQLNQPIKVYNFEVEDWHTYFVSDVNVLVHNSCSEPIRNVYKSIKDAPKYPNGFIAARGETLKVNIKNDELLNQLRKIELGKWNKVYKNGYDSYGNEISIHYCESSSGTVFDVETHDGWSSW